MASAGVRPPVSGRYHCANKRRLVYLLITDCFLLLSLLFLTVGKNNEPPATYDQPRATPNTTLRLTIYRFAALVVIKVQWVLLLLI